MALQTLNNCCTNDRIELQVCDCFEGFQIVGLTPQEIYVVAIRTSKNTYTLEIVTDEFGMLELPVISLPERVFNRFGGVYELDVVGVTWEDEQYVGFQFTVIICSVTGFYLIENTPNE